MGDLSALYLVIYHQFSDAAVFPIRGDHDDVKVFGAGGHDRVDQAFRSSHGQKATDGNPAVGCYHGSRFSRCDQLEH